MSGRENDCVCSKHRQKTGRLAFTALAHPPCIRTEQAPSDRGESAAAAAGGGSAATAGAAEGSAGPSTPFASSQAEATLAASSPSSSNALPSATQPAAAVAGGTAEGSPAIADTSLRIGLGRAPGHTSGRSVNGLGRADSGAPLAAGTAGLDEPVMFQVRLAFSRTCTHTHTHTHTHMLSPPASCVSGGSDL